MNTNISPQTEHTSTLPSSHHRGLFTVIPLPNNTVLQKPSKLAGAVANQQNKLPDNWRETVGNPPENPPPTGDKTPENRPENAPKRGPVGYLYTLPPETQEEILQLLQRRGCRWVSEFLAKPEPDGLGVLVSEDVLGDFRKHHQRLEAQKRLEEKTAHAKSLLALGGCDADLLNAALRLIKVHVLESATAPINDLKQLETLHRIANRLRLTDLAEQRLNKT